MFKKLTIALALSASMFSYTNMAFANNDADVAQLEAVITAKIAATSKGSESIEDIMSTIHSGSPVALETRAQMEQILPAVDMNASLVEFSFVGQAGDYAVAKIKEKAEKITGPAQFKSNEMEQLIVFKQEDGQWKIWQASVLDIKYL
ncbi:MAG: nuclear transport factor 2 family protein [Thiomicrorhabdus sp.]|nr:nuclear transport factor 2 family protein [Thiomicrorhabdus sp.]